MDYRQLVHNISDLQPKFSPYMWRLFYEETIKSLVENMEWITWSRSNAQPWLVNRGWAGVEDVFLFVKKVTIRFFVNLQGYLFCYDYGRKFTLVFVERGGCLKLIHSSSTIALGFISFLSLLERVTLVSARSWTRETPSAKARSSTLHCHCKCTLCTRPPVHGFAFISTCKVFWLYCSALLQCC